MKVEIEKDLLERLLDYSLDGCNDIQANIGMWGHTKDEMYKKHCEQILLDINKGEKIIGKEIYIRQ